MKHLLDFINENINPIFESKFSNKNFICGSNGVKDYHYSIAVIKDLLNNKDVKLVNGKSINISMLNTDKDELENLLKQCTSLKGSYEDFNKLFDEEKIKDLGISKVSQLWNNIEKTPYSKGSTDGGNAEIVVCNSFNNNLSDDDIVEYANKYQISGDTWLESIKNTLNILSSKKWGNKNFVAAQVDGKGIDDISDTGALSKEDIKNITISYSNKKDINKLFNINVNNLYPNQSKDAWNKADILLINKTENTFKKLKDLVNNLSSDTDQSNEYNAILVGLAKSNDIIPISLKKVPDATAKIYSHNFGQLEGFELEHWGDTAELQLPAKELKDDLSGSIYLGMTDNKEIKTDSTFIKGDSPMVQFYTRASSKNNKNGNATAKIELTGKNSKEGSGFLNICKGLGITTKQSYATPDRVKEAVKEYFNWNELPDNVKSSSNWFNKPCFTVIIGLLDKYCEQKKLKHSKDVLNEFTLYCIGCCLGNGSYYIIK